MLNQDELLEQINKINSVTGDRNHVVSSSLKSICKRIQRFNSSEEIQV